MAVSEHRHHCVACAVIFFCHGRGEACWELLQKVHTWREGAAFRTWRNLALGLGLGVHARVAAFFLLACLMGVRPTVLRVRDRRSQV